jgi:peptide/nickel transport system substrate-binding protein
MSRDPGFEEFLEAEISRRQLLKRLGAGGALLSLPGIFAGSAWARGLGTQAALDVAAAGAVRGGVFNFARNQEPLSFDPTIPSDNGSIWVIYNIFDQLTTINKDSSDVVPSLAQSWTISRDGKTYTFHLRPGVKFSDGTPLTADDVVFSLERAFNPKLDAYAFLFVPVKSMKALNSSTVQIKLAHPYAPFLQNLNVFPASIVSKAAYQANPKAFAEKPIGSGPFALKQFVKGQFTHLVRNTHYWKPGQPYVDEVMIPYVADDNTRILKLEAGEIDAAENIPYAQIATLNKRNGLHVAIEPLFRFDGIWLNNEKKPLNDVRVRQALNYATDKVSIVKSILFGHAEVANHMMPKEKYWLSSVKPYPYDINKAKQLIAQSSASKGFTLPLVVPTGDVIIQQVSQVVKQSWSQIGVNVQIQNLDIGTAYTDFSKGNYTAGSNWYITSDVTAPDELAAIEFDYTAPGGFDSFYSYYKSAQASALIHKAAASTSEKTRAKLFGQLQRLVMHDAPLVALYFSPARTGLRSNVHNFHTVKTGWWRLEEVWLKK